jgi:tetratricopeptide (TPR) repeat protein
VRFLYDWNWSGAEEELTRAIELNPASGDAHLWYGVFLAQMGRTAAAMAETKQATALDPLSVAVRFNAGWVFYLARQSDQALEQWRKALDLEPNLGTLHTSIWLAYLKTDTGNPVAAAAREEPGDSTPLDLATVAGIYATTGRRAEAEKLLTKLSELSVSRYVCPYEIATAHAALGRHGDAIDWLRKGVDERSVCMPDMKMDPRLDSLRSDPRFQQLLRDVGFSP